MSWQKRKKAKRKRAGKELASNWTGIREEPDWIRHSPDRNQGRVEKEFEKRRWKIRIDKLKKMKNEELTIRKQDEQRIGNRQ